VRETVRAAATYILRGGADAMAVSAIQAWPLFLLGRLTPRDYAALTPLIRDHVNPYRRFELDMNPQLALP
jgi:hypothetical protein